MDAPQKLGFPPESVIKFYEYTKKMEHEKEHDIFTTWGLKRTIESARIVEDGLVDEEMVDLTDIDATDEVETMFGQKIS